MNNLLDRVIILMPAYNEAARISEVIANCKKYFKNIIIVEDGSSDSTFQEAIIQIQHLFSNIVLIVDKEPLWQQE